MNLKRLLLNGSLVLGVIAGLGFSSWNAAFLPLAHQTLVDIAPLPGPSPKFLVASEREVYLREPGEKSAGPWKRLLSLEGRSSPLKQIVSHPQSPGKIFLLSSEGIIEAELEGGRPKWLFREVRASRNTVHAMAIHPERPQWMYLATERGLFQTKDGGKTWFGPIAWPENQPIDFVGFLPSTPPTLLLGTNRELFFSKEDGGSYESGFSLPFFSEEETEETVQDEEGRPSQKPRFSSFCFSLVDPSQLWIGTKTGVFESRDGGIDWEKLPSRGLEINEVLDLVYSDRSRELIAATSRGVFRYASAQKYWEKLSITLAAPPKAITLESRPGDLQEKLLVASGNQIFEWILGPPEVLKPRPLLLPSPDQMELFRKLVTLEPTARQIQKAAIRYGNLGNGRIKRWQWGSRMRAFVPRLTFSKDFSLGNNVDLDRGGTTEPDKFILGPADQNRGWDLGLAWELGDFLYSTAQTAIDSRQKLNVELRESLLSEVTRIYFERRRIQMEIFLSETERPLQERLDLLLRLDELTAQLDALTNGYFSRALEKLYEQYPEFNRLGEEG